MTVQYSDNVQEQLPTSATEVYSAPSNVGSAHIIYAGVCCEDVLGSSITLNVVKSGDSVAVTNQYVQAKSVVSGGTEILSEVIGRVLRPGDSIHALAADANRLNLAISIKEIY